jgi:hypothetical protein
MVVTKKVKSGSVLALLGGKKLLLLLLLTRANP